MTCLRKSCGRATSTPTCTRGFVTSRIRLRLGPSKAFIEGRKRGIYFDVGQGGGSFKWSLAVPMIKAGFIPDSISTDLHVTSMNGAMKDELNVADKIMAIGVPLKQVVGRDDFSPGARD